MNLNNLTLYDMAFSTRVLEVFKINNVTMEDILKHKYTLNDFLRMPNIGRKSVKEIKEAFLSYGFHFKDGDKHFKDLDQYLDALEAKENKIKEEQSNGLYIDLNLEVIDKCRKALVTSFNNIVQKNSFSHNEFNTVMNEHKKILNMFEQNVRNVL